MTTKQTTEKTAPTQPEQAAPETAAPKAAAAAGSGTSSGSSVCNEDTTPMTRFFLSPEATHRPASGSPEATSPAHPERAGYCIAGRVGGEAKRGRQGKVEKKRRVAGERAPEVGVESAGSDDGGARE